jgi:hypothetical protein
MNREYEGEAIFRSDPSIASDWLELRIRENPAALHREDHLVNAAFDAINAEQRRRLLGKIPQGFWNQEVVAGLVGDDPELYAVLLADKRLQSFHLAPLGGIPNDTWVAKAILALDAGCSPANVTEAAYGSSRSWIGEESAMWAEWEERFGGLLSHHDLRIRTLGQVGQKSARARRERALRRERQEAIYGGG